MTVDFVRGEYEDCVANREGVCMDCALWSYNRDLYAEGQLCEHCGKHSVVGIELVKARGWLRISESPLN